MKKVLLIGSTVCDMILYLDHLPVTQEDVHPYRQVTRIGGCAFNAAHVVAHLKIPYEFISPIGTGVYGDYVKKEIIKHDVKSSVFVEEENGSCLCFVENGGERTFLSVHGAEYQFQPSWLNHLNLDEFQYGYLCGLEVEEKDGQKLVDFVCAQNIQFLFAPGPRLLHIPEERMNQLLKHGVMLHLNDDEALKYTKTSTVIEAAENLYKRCKNTVVITCGSKGCLVFDGQSYWVNSKPVKVADTIGAGDSHAGAFLSALAKGKSTLEAAAFANEVAGQVVSVSSSVLSQEIYDTLRVRM